MALASLYKGNKTFKMTEVDLPSLSSDSVRVRVAYCGICGTDRHIYHGVMDARVGSDHVAGHEMSGIVSETGPGVTKFAKGDRVVVRPLDWCGECGTCKAGLTHICENMNFIGADSAGAFQEFMTVDQRIVYKIPDKLSLRDASLVEPLAVACHDVQRSGIKAGQYAAIIGGGTIGVLIALVLKLKNIEPVVLEISPERRALAEEMGIRTLDPLSSDAEAFIKGETGGSGADVVFEVSASQPGAELMTAICRPRGTIVIVGIYGNPPKVNLKDNFLKELNMIACRVYESRDYYEALDILDADGIPCDKIISGIVALDNIEKAFADLDVKTDALKILVDCGGDE